MAQLQCLSLRRSLGLHKICALPHPALTTNAKLHAQQQAGQGTQLDVVTAQAQLDTDRALVPPIEQELSRARHALAAYIGRSPAEWTPPDFDLDRLTLPRELPVSLPSDLA